MTFPRIVYTYALELIAARIEQGRPSPSDDEIAGYCALVDAGSVRSLLADLADQGKITMKGTGVDRVITLGRQKAAITPAPPPIRSVTKPKPTDDELVDAAMARIKAAVARGKGAVGPIANSVSVESVAPAPSAPAARAHTPAIEEERHAQAAPHPVMAELEQIPPEVVAELSKPALEMVRMPTTQRKLPERRVVERKRQVSFWLSGNLFDQMEAHARALDIATGTYVRRIVEGTSERPRIPGAVATAAIRAGVPVIEFATSLMWRGLASYQTDAL